MKPTEHVLLHSICVLSHLKSACKHLLSLYYWTHWSCWWIYHFKKKHLTRFFIIKARHPGRLKKVDLGGKIPQWEPCVVTSGKTPATVTW